MLHFSNTLCLLPSPYLNLCRHQQQTLSLFPYPTPWKWGYNTENVAHSDKCCWQLAADQVRGTRGGAHPGCSECFSLWPGSWQQKLQMKMALCLGTKWTFLSRSPHTGTGSGSQHLHHWHGVPSAGVCPNGILKSYYFHYFFLSQYSSCLNVSCK